MSISKTRYVALAITTVLAGCGVAEAPSEQSRLADSQGPLAGRCYYGTYVDWDPDAKERLCVGVRSCFGETLEAHIAWEWDRGCTGTFEYESGGPLDWAIDSDENGDLLGCVRVAPLPRGGPERVCFPLHLLD
jgi:hypothetical protein